ncbi:erythrocyte band 7 integral membrane -like [Brachionus plicatilis]|uniref:Erythrocyte band 7 integral membrane-like n=1 Tax=Brachionus plicatilis TaxID=10195 RepID=A0A3M7SAT4_BRAPC|nr:erythrocyte band 7 integral membrane -like [Brachionus plicatilis]
MYYSNPSLLPFTPSISERSKSFRDASLRELNNTDFKNFRNNKVENSNLMQNQVYEQGTVDLEMTNKNSSKFNEESDEPSEGFGICGYLLIGFSYVLVVLTFPISLCCCIKIVKEYERAVIFRLGRSLGGAKGPGLFFILPCIDTITTIDLRTVTFDVPPQEVLTKDSVTTTVDAVVYFRIFSPTLSVTKIENAQYSTRLLAATTLRNVLGTKTLQEILQDKENISNLIQEYLDAATDIWGVKVERVEVKDVRLPVQMQRAMATEAESTREARAKVIAAEGEQKASVALKLAADTINQSPIALQLRYLQTLTNISAEKNSTIIFPIPIEMMQSFIKK